MKTTLSIVILVGVVEIATPTIQAQPQFKGMGKPDIPGFIGFFIYCVNDVSDICGMAGATFGMPWIWNPLSGWTPLKGLQASNQGAIFDSTPDGASFVGTAYNGTRNVPVLWKSRDLPPTPLPGFPMGWTCYDAYCSADGKVVAGQMKNLVTFKFAIYFWRAGVRKNGGWEFIEQFPPGFVYAGINDLSVDGTIGVGGGPDATLEGFQGIRWTKKDGLQVVPDLPGGITDCSFIACDATGFRASNWASPAEEMWIAGLWEPVNGWALIGKMKASHTGASLRIDDSGFAGVGTSGFHISDDRTAFLWNVRDGMRPVEDVLVMDYGLTEVVPWQLSDVDAISPNGRFVTGRGLNPQNKGETWWAEIRPFCYADCDNATSPKGKNAGPPVLNIDDFICFQTKFALGDYLYADCDLNGYLEIDDYICFQTKFALGCP